MAPPAGAAAAAAGGPGPEVEAPPLDTSYDYAIDVVNDPTCRDDPQLQRIIQHVIDTYEENRG